MASSLSSRRFLSVGNRLCRSNVPRSERGTYCRSSNYFWVFGYGSLIWRPGFDFASRHIAVLPGYSVRFWQGSQCARGHVEKPGRVATLAESDQDEAWGVAFKVPIENFDKVMLQLDIRERGYTLYQKDVALQSDTSLGSWTKVPAAVYIAEDLNSNPEYLGPAPVHKMATSIAHAHGECGLNSEYVYKTADSMRWLFPFHVNDHVFELEAAVREQENRVGKKRSLKAWTLLTGSVENHALQKWLTVQ